MSSDDFTSKVAKLCPKPAVLGRMLLDLAVDTLEAVPNSPVNSKGCLMTVWGQLRCSSCLPEALCCFEVNFVVVVVYLRCCVDLCYPWWCIHMLLCMSAPALISAVNKTVYNVIEAHCYALQCRQIDCEQLRSSINQQLIAGHYSHEGLHQLRTKLNSTQHLYAADEGIHGWNVLQSVVDWCCYAIAHNQFACKAVYVYLLWYHALHHLCRSVCRCWAPHALPRLLLTWL